jgi:ABC-3C protein
VGRVACMNDIGRYHYDLRFKCDFLEKKATAFQDFFSELMQKVYPGDFIATRPWGSTGDRKNDGYLKSERTLFQVYAPEEIRATETIAKIDEDFRGALPYWEEYFDIWVFVHNVKGLGPDVVGKLLELDQAHAEIRVDQWGYEALRQQFWRLRDEDIIAWFGAAPSVEAMLSLGYEDLRVVLETIARQTPPPDDVVMPVDAGKLTANALSSEAKHLLALGMRKAKLVGRFFSDWHEPSFGDVVANAFTREYERLKSSGLTPDEILVRLQDFAGGRIHGSPSHETAVLAVLAFLFEQCDIFEPAKPSTIT